MKDNSESQVIQMLELGEPLNSHNYYTVAK